MDDTSDVILDLWCRIFLLVIFYLDGDLYHNKKVSRHPVSGRGSCEDALMVKLVSRKDVYVSKNKASARLSFDGFLMQSPGWTPDIEG